MKKICRILIIVILIFLLLLIYINKNNIMKMIYITKYSEFVEKYSIEYNVDKYLIYACIKAESNFDEKAESKKGAKGLMQLMSSTAEEIAQYLGIEIKEEDLLNPEININLGTKYISQLLQKYSNIELAVAAYNAGAGNVDTWIRKNIVKVDGSDVENIPFKETNNYVRKILKDYKIYKELYE